MQQAHGQLVAAACTLNVKAQSELCSELATTSGEMENLAVDSKYFN